MASTGLDGDVKSGGDDFSVQKLRSEVKDIAFQLRSLLNNKDRPASQELTQRSVVDVPHAQ